MFPSLRYFLPGTCFYFLSALIMWDHGIYFRTYIVNGSQGKYTTLVWGIAVSRSTPLQLFCWYFHYSAPAQLLVPAPSECHARQKARSRATRNKSYEASIERFQRYEKILRWRPTKSDAESEVSFVRRLGMANRAAPAPGPLTLSLDPRATQGFVYHFCT